MIIGQVISNEFSNYYDENYGRVIQEKLVIFRSWEEMWMIVFVKIVSYN